MNSSDSSTPTRTGTLTVAAVPIGRPGDASPLLAHALATAPVIAAEDTRRLRKLAAALGAEPAGKIISYYDAVEQSREPALIATLLAGQDVLLVTDAGMPVISDPGYRLVAAAAAAGVTVTVLPGPSAVIAALAVSGLPTDRFCFEGFPPRKRGERARRLAELASEPRTMVFFESPRRLAATLADLSQAFGADRRAVVGRELTKTHEEVRRGTLAELTDWAADGVLGEITLVVHGAPPAGGGSKAGPPSRTPSQAAQEVEQRIAAGQRRNAAIAAVAQESGLDRAEVYDAVAAARRQARGTDPRTDLRTDRGAGHSAGPHSR
jgi:16S rRNA (cytidine1402-2'-O)-methyltransferase